VESADQPDESTSDELDEQNGELPPEPAATEPRWPDHEIPRPDPPQL